MTQKFYELHSIAFPKPLLQPAASALLCLICVHVFISHMELSLYFQSHVPVQLLSGLSGWGTLREKSAAESPCGCLACFHLWFIQIKLCFWCGGASPTHSQMKEFFLESQWRWDTGPLPLDKMKGQLSEVTGMVLAGTVAAAALSVRQGLVECLHTSSCTCWRDQPAVP